MDGRTNQALPPLPKNDLNTNPQDIGLLTLIREDFVTHDKQLSPGFIILALHRYGNWRMSIRSCIIRLPFSLVYMFLFPILTVFFGIKLYYAVRVGRRVKIERFGNMVLDAWEIGNDVTIRQNTFFGVSEKNLAGKPIIEDRVDIGAGVKIIGNVRIGHDSVIADDAVVYSDIPPFSLAFDFPAIAVKRFDSMDINRSEAQNVAENA